jgi:hypothetical protein
MREKRCTTCHELRPLTDFNLRRSSADGLQARCRACSREWYARNRLPHMARVRERNKRVRAEHQERLAAYLLEHPCVDCGEADLRVLELDHEDPAQKAATVGRLVTLSLPWPTVLAEIEKCSVRCANCHRRRTAEAFGWWRAAAEARRQEESQDLSASRLSRILHPRAAAG